MEMEAFSRRAAVYVCTYMTSSSIDKKRSSATGGKVEDEMRSYDKGGSGPCWDLRCMSAVWSRDEPQESDSATWPDQNG